MGRPRSREECHSRSATGRSDRVSVEGWGGGGGGVWRAEPTTGSLVAFSPPVDARVVVDQGRDVASPRFQIISRLQLPLFGIKAQEFSGERATLIVVQLCFHCFDEGQSTVRQQ